MENEFKKKIEKREEIEKLIYFYERPINALKNEEVGEMITWVRDVAAAGIGEPPTTSRGQTVRVLEGVSAGPRTPLLLEQDPLKS